MKDKTIDTDSPNPSNLQKSIITDTHLTRSNTADNSKLDNKDNCSVKGSIFNTFFKEFSAAVWTGCEGNSNFEAFQRSIQGELYSKDWCFRISKQKKMEWLYIVFKGQFAIAYTDESCKTPLAYFDQLFSKLDYVEIELDDNQIQKSYYGQRFEKMQKFEEIFHLSKDFIANLGQDLSNHCVLSNFNKDYEIVQSIGLGKFSEVYECEHMITGENCAVKVLDKNRILQKGSFGQTLYEITLLKSLDETKNKFTTSLKYIYEGKKYLYLVTDKYHGGNLFEHYVDNKDAFTELDCLRIITSCLKGLAYLETKQIIHRDIKPANFVLQEKKDIDNCTIIDFGQSVKESDVKQNDEAIQLKVGTPGYMAPEMLRGKAYDCKADVFSLGCTMYLLLFEKQLFYLKDKQDCLELNKQCPFEKILKTDLKDKAHTFDKGTIDLLRQMLQRDPSDRPYASELLNHQIIKVSGDFKDRVVKKQKASKNNFVSKVIEPSSITKKKLGSVLKRIKYAFSRKSKSKNQKEFPVEELTRKECEILQLKKLRTSNFKECKYVNCLPKTMDEMSEFVSDASTESGESTC